MNDLTIIEEGMISARPFAPGAEKHLEVEHKVLDHGFVRMVDYMGNDAAIAQAARVSYGRGTKSVSEDRGLIRYLMNHWHSTPFEMCEVKLHVKLPVFVARQWIRHRTANVNEYSARYSIMDREFYIPEAAVMAKQSTTNNQGRGEILDPEVAREVQEVLLRDAMRAYDHYELMLGDPDKRYCDDEGDFVPGKGLARELARMNLPTNIYTQWYWKVDLHNLFHFLRLRADPHAQYEIRAYADAICNMVRDWVPTAYEAFEDFRLNAKQFSSMEMAVVSALVAMDETRHILESPEAFREFCEPHGMSVREARELRAKLNG